MCMYMYMYCVCIEVFNSTCIIHISHYSQIAVSNILMRAKKMVDETQEEYDRLVGDDKV